MDKTRFITGITQFKKSFILQLINVAIMVVAVFIAAEGMFKAILSQDTANLLTYVIILLVTCIVCLVITVISFFIMYKSFNTLSYLHKNFKTEKILMISNVVIMVLNVVMSFCKINILATMCSVAIAVITPYMYIIMINTVNEIFAENGESPVGIATRNLYIVFMVLNVLSGLMMGLGGTEVLTILFISLIVGVVVFVMFLITLKNILNVLNKTDDEQPLNLGEGLN